MIDQGIRADTERKHVFRMEFSTFALHLRRSWKHIVASVVFSLLAVPWNRKGAYTHLTYAMEQLDEEKLALWLRLLPCRATMWAVNSAAHRCQPNFFLTKSRI
jgi:hypothetical protein